MNIWSIKVLSVEIRVRSRSYGAVTGEPGDGIANANFAAYSSLYDHDVE